LAIDLRFKFHEVSVCALPLQSLADGLVLRVSITLVYVLDIEEYMISTQRPVGMILDDEKQIVRYCMTTYSRASLVSTASSNGIRL